MVVAEEFGDWEDSNRRIDLLCLDRQAHLVVVELKRSEDGGHMELQAIRYAAMVSSMTFEQLVEAHARFIGGPDSRQKAESSVLSFLGWDAPSEGSLSGDVGIILVGANFSTELTTAVLWLNKRGLDISCIRLKPYRLDGEILLDIQQIIPLPEAGDYETRIRAQEQEGQRAETTRQEMFRRFWKQLIDRSRTTTAMFANRTGSKDQWIGISAGREGFRLNLVALQDKSRVECFIDLGSGLDEQNLAAFSVLEQQKVAIESTFGEPLDWQPLDEKQGCRICKVIEGGYKTPESDWPTLQERLIETAIRLEKALRQPIRNLSLAEE